MPDPILEVDELTVYRGKSLAVQGVSFSLTEGTDMAIVGPNGAGKSTLVQAILGILPHHSGQVWVLGQPLSRNGHLSQQARQKVAYLPQNCLFDRRIPLVVEEFVELGWNQLGFELPWSNRKQRQWAVKEALEQVGAFHLRQKPISQLSGGEIKRMLLAYCLVRPRRLLILDEAPAGLDRRGESQFYQILHQLKEQQGWAILQISHNLDRVRQHCDRVVCLNRTVLWQGKPESALSPDNLAMAYGSEFVGYQG